MTLYSLRLINTFVKEGYEKFQLNLMPRYLRSSKKKVDLELKSIEKNKKLLPREKEKQRSRDLKKVIEENQETLWEEIVKLKNIANTDEESSSEDESEELNSSEGGK